MQGFAPLKQTLSRGFHYVELKNEAPPRGIAGLGQMSSLGIMDAQAFTQPARPSPPDDYDIYWVQDLGWVFAVGFFDSHLFAL